MTDAQTEARAIEVLSLETPAGNLIDAVHYEDHVAALAAKDAELAAAEHMLELSKATTEAVLERAERAEAQLAEARKALEEIIARSNNDPLGTSKVIDMRNIARRALEAQGGENG